ncbi:MAG: nucleotidyl transferase AbiEii/AbiGii toxin family protein [Eggerthellaceae bacterium]|nr:nucleotidyl transferase AbiEii/AbiGii toxin family protein [Eggerthellaceae bacterium]
MTDASMKARVKNLAQQTGLSPQIVLQMHLLERLLERFSKSRYANNVVLKGGMLIASMAGIAQRTTMDMDTTVTGMPVDEEHVRKIFEEVCSLSGVDPISFELSRIEPIREEDEYPGFRVHVAAQFGKVRASLKVDITTGDSLVPGALTYPYSPILGGDNIPALSYAPETVLAEKFETIIRRGELNGRARDFYDVVLMTRLYHDSLDWEALADAIRATSQRRGTEQALRSWQETLSAVRSSPYINETIWAPYAKANTYAASVTIDDVVDTCIYIAQRTRL